MCRSAAQVGGEEVQRAQKALGLQELTSYLDGEVDGDGEGLCFPGLVLSGECTQHTARAVALGAVDGKVADGVKGEEEDVVVAAGKLCLVD